MWRMWSTLFKDQVDFNEEQEPGEEKGEERIRLRPDDAIHTQGPLDGDHAKLEGEVGADEGGSRREGQGPEGDTADQGRKGRGRRIEEREAGRAGLGRAVGRNPTSFGWSLYGRHAESSVKDARATEAKGKDITCPHLEIRETLESNSEVERGNEGARRELGQVQKVSRAEGCFSEGKLCETENGASSTAKREDDAIQRSPAGNSEDGYEHQQRDTSNRLRSGGPRDGLSMGTTRGEGRRTRGGGTDTTKKAQEGRQVTEWSDGKAPDLKAAWESDDEKRGRGESKGDKWIFGCMILWTLTLKTRTLQGKKPGGNHMRRKGKEGRRRMTWRAFVTGAVVIELCKWMGTAACPMDGCEGSPTEQGGWLFHEGQWNATRHGERAHRDDRIHRRYEEMRQTISGEARRRMIQGPNVQMDGEEEIRAEVEALQEQEEEEGVCIWMHAIERRHLGSRKVWRRMREGMSMRQLLQTLIEEWRQEEDMQEETKIVYVRPQPYISNEDCLHLIMDLRPLERRRVLLIKVAFMLTDGEEGFFETIGVRQEPRVEEMMEEAGLGHMCNQRVIQCHFSSQRTQYYEMRQQMTVGDGQYFIIDVFQGTLPEEEGDVSSLMMRYGMEPPHTAWVYTKDLDDPIFFIMGGRPTREWMPFIRDRMMSRPGMGTNDDHELYKISSTPDDLKTKRILGFIWEDVRQRLHDHLAIILLDYEFYDNTPGKRPGPVDEWREVRYVNHRSTRREFLRNINLDLLCPIQDDRCLIFKAGIAWKQQDHSRHQHFDGMYFKAIIPNQHENIPIKDQFHNEQTTSTQQSDAACVPDKAHT